MIFHPDFVILIPSKDYGKLCMKKCLKIKMTNFFLGILVEINSYYTCELLIVFQPYIHHCSHLEVQSVY